MNSSTRDTTHLEAAEPTSIGVAFKGRDRSLTVLYRIHKQHNIRTERAGFGMGLVLGAMIMMGVLGYGLPVLGGIVLVTLIVLAIWHAGRSE